VLRQRPADAVECRTDVGRMATEACSSAGGGTRSGGLRGHQIRRPL
jgi:hypothetical protein